MKAKNSIDKFIFYGTVLVYAVIMLPMLINPEKSGEALNSILGFTTNQLGWVYLLFIFAALIVLIWLGFGKYGDVKFGGPDDKPDFSTLSWIAMLFCAGIGSSILYWSPIEWAYYYKSTSLGVEPFTPRAAEIASSYGMFHWGLSAWAAFSLPTLPIAYSYYVKKKPVLRLSAICEEVLGKRITEGPIGKTIDIFIMFGILGGIGTTIGLGAPMVAGCIGSVFGVESSMTLNVVVIVIWTCLFSISVWLGLEKGIKRFSDVNLYLALFFAGYVLLVGPTAFILNTWLNGVGDMLQNFVSRSLWTDPIAAGGFPQSWTVFYWAWWIAWAPFVSLFIAKISKGRTIRETVIGVNLIGSLGCWIYYGIFGNYAMSLELTGKIKITEILSQQGGVQAIVAVLQSLPLSSLILPLFIVLAFIFLTTSLDSAAYTLASIASEEVPVGEDPARWHRVFWAFALAFLPLTLISVGGLKALQTSSIVLAFPVTIVLVIMTISFVKRLKMDHEQLKPHSQVVPTKIEDAA